VVTATIQIRFDGRSTIVRLESLRSPWRNTYVPAVTLAAVTLTGLFIYAAVSTVVTTAVEWSSRGRIDVEWE